MALIVAASVLGLGLATTASAQGKKKPAASYPGVAGFRCDPMLAGDCAIVGPTVGDGVVGVVTPQNSSLTYPGSGTPEGGRGAHFRSNSGNTNHEMWIGLRDGFQVLLNIGSEDVNAPCRTNGNNYCQYPAAFGESILIGSTYAEIQSDVVDVFGSSAPTLLTLPILSEPPSEANASSVRILIGFNDPSGRLWNFNFSDARNSGAQPASIWRTGACTWIINDGGAQAELSTLIRIAGKQFRSFEGLYSAPFEITFIGPNCPVE
jgi:hypothetical protein